MAEGGNEARGWHGVVLGRSCHLTPPPPSLVPAYAAHLGYCIHVTGVAEVCDPKVLEEALLHRRRV